MNIFRLNKKTKYIIKLFFLFLFIFFFFNYTATTEIYTLSLHDALPIQAEDGRRDSSPTGGQTGALPISHGGTARGWRNHCNTRRGRGGASPRQEPPQPSPSPRAASACSS